jgi:predicted MFS family arabinose efflux permease
MTTAWNPSLTGSRLYTAWVVLLFTLVATFGFVDRIIIQVLVQPIKTELKVSDAQMGLLGGLAFAVLYVLLSIPIARLAERRNRLAIVSVSTTLWSLATVLSGFAANFTQLLLARVGVGIGEAGNTPATYSILSDTFPRERRASAASIYSLAAPCGAFMGGALGGYVALHWGWRAAFQVVGLPGVLLALLMWVTLREPPRGRHDPGVDMANTPPFSAVLRRFAQRASLIHVVLGATLAAVGGYGINYFVAAYLTRHFGLDYAQAGLRQGLISSVPAALSIMAGGFLSDWAGRRGAFWYALIPGLGAFFCVPFIMVAFRASTADRATELLAAAAVFQYAYIPASAAITQNMMEPRMRATAMAITGLVYTLVGQGLGPWLVGSLSDNVGLQSALALWPLIYLWSGAHLVLGARTLGRDFARGDAVAATAVQTPTAHFPGAR